MGGNGEKIDEQHLLSIFNHLMCVILLRKFLTLHANIQKPKKKISQRISMTHIITF